MQQQLPLFSGTGVALITPFNNTGAIDWPVLASLIDYVIEGGVNYIVSLGTTGEAITLSREECRKILTYTVEKVDGRVPVVAGYFGSNYTERLVQAVADYDFTGVSGIMSSSPAYSKPSQEGIYQHYMRLADASPLPVIIYNVPGRTSSNVHPETILRLAEASTNFCGVKEASGDLSQAMQILKYRPDHFGVYSGEDPLSLSMIAAGAHGSISVIANLFPKQYSTLVKAALAGDFTTARAKNNELLDVHPWLYVEGNPVGIKAAMSWAGLCENELRVPLIPMSKNNYQHLVTELEKVGMPAGMTV
ncbi:MAG: 4-hydroxy-tetrahydrodipicolinate synthase [Bacteroidota bacterium]